MSDFEDAERADAWMGRVRDWIYGKARAVGTDTWNEDPALRATRERSVRLLVRAANRREREIGRLAARGVPEPVTRVWLNTRTLAPERADTKARDRARVRS
jgi:hypothetical protein